jgi:hypothetical protein
VGLKVTDTSGPEATTKLKIAGRSDHRQAAVDPTVRFPAEQGGRCARLVGPGRGRPVYRLGRWLARTRDSAWGPLPFQ